MLRGTRRVVATAAAVTLLDAAVSGCTSSGGGPFTLNFYNFPDNSGAIGANKIAAEDGTLKIPLQTATWQGRLVAVPYNTDARLLWYRAGPAEAWAR